MSTPTPTPTQTPNHRRGRRLAALAVALVAFLGVAVAVVALTSQTPLSHRNIHGLPDVSQAANVTVVNNVLVPSQFSMAAGTQYLVVENHDAVAHVMDIPLQTSFVEDVGGSPATMMRQSSTDVVVSMPAGSRAVAAVNVTGAGTGPIRCLNGAMRDQMMGTVHMMAGAGASSSEPMRGAPMMSVGSTPAGG